MQVHKFTKIGGSSAVLDGNSNPMFIGDTNNFPGGMPFTIFDATAMLGAFEGVLAHPDDDLAVVLHDSTGDWEEIDGGDLTPFTGGGASALFAPYNYIRIRRDSGVCSARMKF